MTGLFDLLHQIGEDNRNRFKLLIGMLVLQIQWVEPLQLYFSIEDWHLFQNWRPLQKTN